MTAPATTRQPRLDRRPPLRVLARERHVARLHLFTYIVGNALFWLLWGAVSVSADSWYWWALAPLAGWSFVLALHLWFAHDNKSARRRLQ